MCMVCLVVFVPLKKPYILSCLFLFSYNKLFWLSWPQEQVVWFSDTFLQTEDALLDKKIHTLSLKTTTINTKCKNKTRFIGFVSIYMISQLHHFSCRRLEDLIRTVWKTWRPQKETKCQFCKIWKKKPTHNVCEKKTLKADTGCC